MRVAIFTDSFPPSKGGTENAVVRYATSLSKDYEVAVFAPQNDKEFDDNQFPFKVFRSFSIKITSNDFWALPRLSGKMKKQLKEFNPDIIHTQTLGMMADFANSYGKKHNIPVVCTAHTKYKYCYQSALKIPLLVNMVVNRIIKRAQKADLVCAVSNSMKDELYSYGLKNKDVLVVRNGHNVNEIKKPQVTRTEQRFTLMYCGLVIDYKNIGFSLKALSILKKQRDDFVFYIVGAGPHEKKFKKMAKKLGIENNVVMTGWIQDKTQLAQYFCNSDMILFTSIFDTDGLILLESAEYDKPAFLIKDSGASERFKDNQTAFIEEYDAEKVAERINYLMDNPDLVQKVGKQCKNCFNSWDETASEYKKIYNQLLSNEN